MKVSDIRLFTPCKDIRQSQDFYQALGFSLMPTSQDVTLCQHGAFTFFLYHEHNQPFSCNLIMQLVVEDIQSVAQLLDSLADMPITYQPVVQQPWGKVIMLWGPSGEQWQITQLNP